MSWWSRVTNVFDSLWRDLRFGQRLLRKDAAVSSAAIVSLGLAIGACTAAFSLVDALILRKLPVRDPESARLPGSRRKAGRSAFDPDVELSPLRSGAPGRGAADGSLQHEPAVAPSGGVAGCRRRRREAAHAVRVGQRLRRPWSDGDSRTRARAIGRRDAGWASGCGDQSCVLEAPARWQSRLRSDSGFSSSSSRTRSSGSRRPDSRARSPERSRTSGFRT